MIVLDGDSQDAQLSSKRIKLPDALSSAITLIRWHDGYSMPVHHSGTISEYILSNPKCTLKWFDCSCWIAEKIRGYELSENVHLSGLLADMTYDEYMSIFNSTETEWNEKTHDLVCSVFVKDSKEVNLCNAEELQSRIHALQTLKNYLIVRAMKVSKHLGDIIESANDDEREEIRKRDRQYKPKPQVIKEAKPKISQSKDEKMRATLKGLGMDDEAIEKFIIEKRK